MSGFKEFTVEPPRDEGARPVDEPTALAPTEQDAPAEASPPLRLQELAVQDAPGPTHERSHSVDTRAKLRSAMFAIQTMDPYLKSQRARKDHWKPLKLRFDGGHDTPSAVRHRPKAPKKQASRDYHHIPEGRRGDTRFLKGQDAHVQLPPDLGNWLVQPQNVAPDPLDKKNQQILYVAKISMRYKDHVISEGPCAYAIACPFPIMVFQYFLSLWRVYTCQGCPEGVSKFDQPAMWKIKQYDLRTYVHVFNNRIEANYPTVRFPWGILGCGSWNADNVVVHYFDRGAFGFRQVPCATRHHCLCAWEPFGEIAGRQRCPCNGPLIDRKGTVRCNQCCCDHWCFTVCCCHYHYPGLQDAAEFAAAADVALQAFFDGQQLTKEQFDRLLDRELLVRKLPKRHSTRDMQKRYDVDSHSYSRTTAIVAVSVGCVTILLQIFVAVAAALYIQYTVHREWYESYWQTFTTRAGYEGLWRNTTQFASDFVAADGVEA
eukprot:CAMPEP_0206051550 /NCGR_PEP_ID=MMETSP1466-20131121/31734_1 /ASSEMBLY_ACC=CAM_ASM_001126 /TAXON_ID=44452 /ORGANISM="Pavlova gyrans, Strain CCMP608" /LENGTH=487 /DNA_ID=CAMNT_0053426679 /DNA_START=1 /DNA_END=1464 /DNA_ORIENTATION=+